MTIREEISPSTLAVDLHEDGVAVEYLDGRTVYYRGVPEARGERVRTPPGKDVHVLVTDADGSQGVLTYVNDLKTHGDILRESGVGRVLLEPGEETTAFPGVSVGNESHRIVVEADPGAVDGRVFVFVEDELSEHGYELLAADD
ncbi:MAG: DUF5796 family protein [Haloarculaceae archaeon]